MLFLGVFLISGTEDIRKFAETYHVTFPVGKDSGVARALGVQGIPETVFVSADGKIVHRHRGPVTFDDISAGVAKLIAPAPQQPGNPAGPP